MILFVAYRHRRRDPGGAPLALTPDIIPLILILWGYDKRVAASEPFCMGHSTFARAYHGNRTITPDRVRNELECRLYACKVTNQWCSHQTSENTISTSAKTTKEIMQQYPRFLYHIKLSYSDNFQPHHNFYLRYKYSIFQNNI